MLYKIITSENGWITNEEGQILIRDTESQADLWIDSNFICYDENNLPYLKINEDSQNSEDINIVALQVDEDASSSQTTAAENKENKNKYTWTPEASLALIASVESRYDNLFHVHKKKTFWNVVHEKLLSQGFDYPPKTCQKKWENLQRTYNSSKDLKGKTGRGPTKFMFYNRMDKILGDTPSNSSPHSIDVRKLQEKNQHSDDTQESEASTSSSSNRKRKNHTVEYIKLKKQYLEERISERAIESQKRDKYLQDLINIKITHNNLLDKRLTIEERKVAALEKIAASCNNKEM